MAIFSQLEFPSALTPIRRGIPQFSYALIERSLIGRNSGPCHEVRRKSISPFAPVSPSTSTPSDYSPPYFIRSSRNSVTGTRRRGEYCTWEASTKDVSWLICSRGWTVSKKTDVWPDPQMALLRIKSMHLRLRTRGSFGGISMG